jgi:hypothetical protein
VPTAVRSIVAGAAVSDDTAIYPAEAGETLPARIVARKMNGTRRRDFFIWKLLCGTNIHCILTKKYGYCK